MFSGLGLCATCFIIHGLVLHGWVIQSNRISLNWIGLTGSLNLIRAVVYSARIPEDGTLEGMIFLEAVTRYSISWSSSPD